MTDESDSICYMITFKTLVQKTFRYKYTYSHLVHMTWKGINFSLSERHSFQPIRKALKSANQKGINFSQLENTNHTMDL